MKVAIILKAPNFNQEVLEKDVIYADGAYKNKEKIGEKNVLAVVGDFDSLNEIPTNQNVVKLNQEKDFTDGERAVRLAKELGYSDVVIYGAYGGKMEHVLGNLALLKIAKNLGLKAVIKDGGITQLISSEVELKVKVGDTLSLIPYGGSCEFINSTGLYYPLNDITLTPYDTRGISNKATSSTVTIKIKNGEALVIYE